VEDHCEGIPSFVGVELSFQGDRIRRPAFWGSWIARLREDARHQGGGGVILYFPGAATWKTDFFPALCTGGLSWDSVGRTSSKKGGKRSEA